MDKKEDDRVAAFDTLFTNNHIQMMKIVMPYLDRSMQKQLAVFIKYQEFQYTLSYFRSHSYELIGCSASKEELNVGKLCTEVLPYCTGPEKTKLEQISGIFRSMEMYQEMSKTFEMMKEIFPEGSQEMSGLGIPGEESGAGGFQMNIGDMLMNMLSPEQKAMFDMFGGNDSNESERVDE